MATHRVPQLAFGFQPKLSLDFQGGAMSTDPGLLVLRELDHRLKLTQSLRSILADGRDARYVRHEALPLLRQRIYQIAGATRTRSTRTFFASIRPFRRSSTRRGRASRWRASRPFRAWKTAPAGRMSGD